MLVFPYQTFCIYDIVKENILVENTTGICNCYSRWLHNNEEFFFFFLRKKSNIILTKELLN